jgi:hypothetical protein
MYLRWGIELSRTSTSKFVVKVHLYIALETWHYQNYCCQNVEMSVIGNAPFVLEFLDP